VNHVAASKTVEKVEVSVAAGATHSLEIDTIGFAHASIDVAFSPFTAAAATAATAAVVLRLAQSDASGSGQTNISGFVAGTDFTVAAGSTTGANVHAGEHGGRRDGCSPVAWRSRAGLGHRQGRCDAGGRLIGLTRRAI